LPDEPRLSDLTPFILAWNEEANIARCLESVAWAAQILLLDSGSTDRTLEIASRYRQVRIIQRRFTSHAEQANFGLALIASPWVLSLDADYVLTAEFQRALREGAIPWDEGCVYFAPFRFCVQGRPLRRSIYPPRGVLYAVKGARYAQDGHTQRISTAGRRKVALPYFILHDDRKHIHRWLDAQRNYAALEAEKLARAKPGELGLPDRLRRTGWAAPLVVVPYVLFARGLILDGWRGVLYAFQRGYAELLLALFLLENRLRPPG
jgi:glycosyltransferase involved in cell wall biosynthesis